MPMTKSFRLLTLAGLCALALAGLAPGQARAEAGPAGLLATPLIQTAFRAPPLQSAAGPASEFTSELTLAFAVMTAVDSDAGKALATGMPEGAQILALLATSPVVGPDGATATAFTALALDAASPLTPAEAPDLPEIAVVALEAVRPEPAPMLARQDEAPAPLLAEAPLEAVRQEETAETDPALITLAELDSYAGGTGVNIGLLTNQILTGISAGNSINAGQVSSGGITIETDAFSGYDGIGNFVINSGHNNVLQSSVNVSIVMTPP